MMWKDVVGWEDYYEVSDTGLIRNKITNHIVVGDINSAGYPRVYLYNKNHEPQKERKFRHRIVAEAFIPNDDNKLEINHKNHNKLDSSINNLEWVSRQENVNDNYINGSLKYKPIFVEYNNGVKEIYKTKTILAQKLNVSKACISFWLNNKNNGYLNYNIKEIRYANWCMIII